MRLWVVAQLRVHVSASMRGIMRGPIGETGVKKLAYRV